MPDEDQTRPDPSKFDFSAYPPDTLFLDRRTLGDRRNRGPAPAVAGAVTGPAVGPPERRARKERRRRVDPTTFEKQYTDDEIEFMNAIQGFKTRTGKAFPSHGDILRVAVSLGYRKGYPESEPGAGPEAEAEGDVAKSPIALLVP